MNRQTIEEIVLRIFSEYQGDISRELMREEVPLDIPVEVSARHVHLTESAIEILFGKGKKLTPKKMLSQPGQFLCEERVALVTARGRIENVAVLGPARAAIQTELSATDCRTLGIKAPLRLSGDLRDAADVYIIGPCGFVFARNSVIIAQAHIHMTPEQADSAGIRDGEQVCVKLGDERRLSLENVICRVSSSAALAMHIDFDEANACMLSGSPMIKIQKHRGGLRACAASEERCPGMPAEAGTGKTEESPGIFWEEGLITEESARRMASDGKKEIRMRRGTIVTPSARDVLLHAGIKLTVQSGR